MPKYRIKYLEVTIDSKAIRAIDSNEAIKQFNETFKPAKNQMRSVINVEPIIETPKSTIMELEEKKPLFSSKPRKDISQVSGDFSFGDISLDLNNKAIVCGDNIVTLTTREFELFTYLITDTETTHDPKDILKEVYGWDVIKPNDTKMVSTTASKIRKKLKKIESNVCIAYLRGQGYILMIEDE